MPDNNRLAVRVPAISTAAIGPLPTLELNQSLWSMPEGNEHAEYRDQFLRRRIDDGGGTSFFKAYHPPRVPGVPDDVVPALGDLHLYVVPGERVNSASQKQFAQLRRNIADPSIFPKRVEIEFCRWPDRAEPLPKNFKGSAITWALEVCDTLLLCVDHAPGRANGEAHEILAPVQAVFRCREENLAVWHAFLAPKLRGRHTLSVVHAAAGRA